MRIPPVTNEIPKYVKKSSGINTKKADHKHDYAREVIAHIHIMYYISKQCTTCGKVQVGNMMVPKTKVDNKWEYVLPDGIPVVKVDY